MVCLCIADGPKGQRVKLSAVLLDSSSELVHVMKIPHGLRACGVSHVEATP